MKDNLGNDISDQGKPYRQGMIFRCDIDLGTAKATNVETLGHNFRNNYEVCVDSFGGMWQSDNDDDGNKGVRINAILDYGSYGYTDEITGAGWRTPRTNIETEVPLMHWHQNDPGTIPNLLQTGGGSPTGILINEGKLLGKTFENQLIHCDAGPRTVRAYPVKKVGAGYTAEMVDILTTDDNWYRPADVAIAPDGSLFVADWYDPGVGGHNMGDNVAEKIRGRVYRVAPKGNAYQVPAKVDFNSAVGCAEALKSPNNSTRYVAYVKLQALGAKAEDVLQALWKSDDAVIRARAFHLLLRLPGQHEKWLAKGLEDKDADIRVTAVRELRLASATNTLTAGLKDLPAYLLPRIKKEADKQVLREYAVTLRTIIEPVKEGGADAKLQTRSPNAGWRWPPSTMAKTAGTWRPSASAPWGVKTASSPPGSPRWETSGTRPLVATSSGVCVAPPHWITWPGCSPTNRPMTPTFRATCVLWTSSLTATLKATPW